MKEIHLHLDRCYECPHSRTTGYLREECGHPQIDGRLIEKPYESGGIPAWCPLPDVVENAPEVEAMFEARGMPDNELMMAMIAELLTMIQHSGSDDANARAIALRREAQRRRSTTARRA